ncbi:MAG: hypothetical protein ACTHLN_15120 [Tepidisphaeraceae bacterium]
MVTLNAHFDGKVIVPDEPLALKPNQRLRISVEPIEVNAESGCTNFRDWIGVAARAGDQPYDAAEEDAAWEKGPLSAKTPSNQV